MSKTYNSVFYQEWYQQCLKDLCKSSLNLSQHQRNIERKSDHDFSMLSLRLTLSNKSVSYF